MTGRSRSCGSPDELLEHLEAVHLRHLHVEEHEVEALAAQHLERHAPVLRGCGLVALLLEAAREQQPVDLVVVDDQEPGRSVLHFTHRAGPSAPPPRANIPASAHRAPSGPPPAPNRGRPARSDLAIAARPSAPKVLLLDFSECAARRNLSASFAARELRMSESIVGASSRKAFTSSFTKSAPAVSWSSLKVAGSIVGSAMSCSLRCCTWVRASTSRSTRIGLVR